jgi:hypothetical protein
VLNLSHHYFNDDPLCHNGCAKVWPDCPVAKAVAEGKSQDGIKAIRPHLVGGHWLGERCVTPQEAPIRTFYFSNGAIDKMQTKDLTKNQKKMGFPDMKANKERKRVLKLLCQKSTVDKQLKIFVRIKLAVDGSWGVRSYTNTAHETRKAIASSRKSKSCCVCEQSKTLNKEPPKHFCSQNHYGPIKSIEAETILDCVKTLVKQDALAFQMATDGDSTSHKFVQVTMIEEPCMRILGGEAIVDPKSDNRHRNKCTKDTIWKFCENNI